MGGERGRERSNVQEEHGGKITDVEQMGGVLQGERGRAGKVVEEHDGTIREVPVQRN